MEPIDHVLVGVVIALGNFPLPYKLSHVLFDILAAGDILSHLGVGQALASSGVLAILHNGHAHLHQGFQGGVSHTANAFAIGFLNQSLALTFSNSARAFFFASSSAMVVSM